MTTRLAESDKICGRASGSSWICDKRRINYLLREAIKELKNVDRVLSARQLEIYYYLEEFERLGFKWQAKRLRNHIHLAIKQGRFTARRADPIEDEGGPSL